MQKSKASPPRKPELAELNPEFAGIGRKLNRSHIVKKQTQKNRNEKYNRVSFLMKEEDQAEKLVLKKQKELEGLMTVLARKQAESIEREERRRVRDEQVAVQREANMRRRNEHQDRVRNAFLSLYDEHQDNVSHMKETSRRQAQMRRSFRKEVLSEKNSKVQWVNKDKEHGRERISSYLKEKADMFTSRYKQKISQEEAETQRLSSQTRQMGDQEQALKLKLQTSNTRIEALNEEILKASMQSRVIQANPSWNWSALSKNYHTLDTKEESSNNPDSKLDRLIEKELSLDDEEMNKL